MSNDTRPTGFSSTDDTGHTREYSWPDGSKLTWHSRFPIAEAAEAVAEFMAHREHDNPGKRDVLIQDRALLGEDGKPVAYLVSAESYDEGRMAVNEAARVAELPPSDGHYRPFLHSLDAREDRLYETSRLERHLQVIEFGDREDLTREEENLLKYRALDATIMIGLDPDARGMVPLRTMNRPLDSEHTEYYWGLAFATKVPGMFLRASDAFFGEQYRPMTAAGFLLGPHFESKEAAEEFLADLHEALPGVDWFTIHRDGASKKIAGTVREVVARFHPWGRREQPKPAPVPNDEELHAERASRRNEREDELGAEAQS